jgi:amino acid adenylation domain-containing protein
MGARDKTEIGVGLLHELKAARIQVTLDGSQLRVRAPAGSLTDSLKARMRANRDALIDALKRDAADNLAHGPVSMPRRENPGPLSFAQRRLWFLERVNAGSSAYVIGGAVRVRGVIDPDLLFRACRQVVLRHEALRTRFGETEGEPFAEILDDLPPSLELVDIPGIAEQDRMQNVQEQISRKMRLPFNLDTGPLFSMTVYRFAPDDHVLLTRVHHIVSDGWSLAVISGELLEVYSALQGDRPDTLPPVEAHAADHAQWELERSAAGRWDKDFAYWTKELAGAPALTELPVDRPHPSRPSYTGARHDTWLDPGTSRAVRDFAKRTRTTPFMVTLAAFQVLLHRHSGQEDVLIGSPLANRMDRRFGNTVGCLINNVVLRGELGGDPVFSDYLEQVRSKVLSSHDHCEPPFDLVVEALKPERATSHAPVFQVLFTLLSYPGVNEYLPGTTRTDISVETGATRFDLSVEIVEHTDRFKVSYEYARDLFDRSTVMVLHERFKTLLNAIMSDPGRRVSEFGIVSEDDQAKLAELASARPAEYDRAACTDLLIDDIAARFADHQAVVAGDDVLDYRTLVRRANGLAARLVSEGVEPGDLVAVALEPNCDLIVGLLAVWKARAAYVPLDPAHPADRLTMVLEDAAPRALITNSTIADNLPNTEIARLLIDKIEVEQLDKAPRPAADGEDLAYVIYTSGSTGRPKGVEVRHRNLVSFLAAMRNEPGLSAEDRVMSVTTPSFDIAGLEYWLPLTTGATTVIADRAQRIDGAALARLLDAQRITMMQATPATWRLLLDSGWAGMLRLKALCGGEAMPQSLAEALIPRVMALWNMYGPTETTIWSTLQRIATAEDAASIGRPIQNTRIAVVDEQGRALPPGIVGELCIAGDGVARGYRNRPELTADRFAKVAFPESGPVLAYRTGDLVRQRLDGGIVFVGRNDFQVKVRGFRVELGEVETRLSAVPGVANCVVVVHAPEGGQAALCAYVVPVAKDAFDPDRARRLLRAELPEYMVPGSFILLDALPLTANLKVDRKALPIPGTAAEADVVQVAEDVVMNETERQIAALWCEVLGLRRVGLNQSFFDAGGHSMLLVKLHEKLKASFGERIPLIDLFRRTTVASQAEAYDGDTDGADKAAVARARQRAERYDHD